MGLYASLIDVNAYHQPGVEAGKKAAARVIELQGKVMSALATAGAEGLDTEQLADRVGGPATLEAVHLLLERLCADPSRRVRKMGDGMGVPSTAGGPIPGAKFRII